MSRGYISNRVRLSGGPAPGTGEEDVQMSENQDLVFGDSEEMRFGDDGDVVIKFEDTTFKIFRFGDYGDVAQMTITDYTFPFRMNVASIANPGSEKLLALLFLKVDVTTEDQAYLDVQGIGMTLEAAFNVGYLHAFEGAVNLTDDLTVAMSVHAGKFGVDRTTGKTITGTLGETLSAVLAQISGNGVNTGFGSDGGEQGAVLECKTLGAADVTSMIWLNLLNGTTATNAITVGNGHSGNITNLFWFVNADAGNCVVVGAACDCDGYDSDAAIRVLVGSTAYYIPLYNAGHTGSSW